MLPNNVYYPSKSRQNYRESYFSYFSDSSFCWRYFPEYLNFFIEKYSATTRRKINRIFISRKVAEKGRDILNEDELFNMLSKYGFKKYILEDMLIEDQLDLSMIASMLWGPHGRAF